MNLWLIGDWRGGFWQTLVHRIVPEYGTVIYTDKAGHYEGVKRERHSVNHKANEYARIVDLADWLRGKATTNYTESAWSMLKRSFMGVYHKMSPKHLRRYVKTFTGRWNIRDPGTENQMRCVVRAMLNRRITYNELTADNGVPSGSGQNGAYFPERRERYIRTK